MPAPPSTARPPSDSGVTIASSGSATRPTSPSAPSARSSEVAQSRPAPNPHDPTASRRPAGSSAKRPVVWVALTTVFFASSAGLAMLYFTSRSDLSDTTEELAATRAHLTTEKRHAQELDGRLSATNAKLDSTQSDLASARDDAKDLSGDLKTAEVCLRGFEQLGSATTQQQVFSIVVRIRDECKKAYQIVHNNLPG